MRIKTAGNKAYYETRRCVEILTITCNLIAYGSLSIPKKMQTPRKRSSDAFTLMEVTLAALVMLAGIVGIIQVISSGTEMLDVSRKQIVATRIIHSEIDKLRLNDWARFTLLSSNETAVIDPARDPQRKTLFYDGLNGSTPLNTPDKLKIVEVGTTIDPSFTCTRQIDDVRVDHTLRKITFTVTWQSIKGRSYSRKGFTYFGKNGLYVGYQRS